MHKLSRLNSYSMVQSASRGSECAGTLIVVIIKAVSTTSALLPKNSG